MTDRLCRTLMKRTHRSRLFLLVLALLAPTNLLQQASAQVLLGAQTIETSVDSNTLGKAEAFQTTANLSGSVGTLTVYLDSKSTATKLYLGLYGDNNGHPGALLTQGSSTNLTAGAWNTVSVPAASVITGTRYWIALLGTTSGTPFFRDRASGSCKSEGSAQSGLASLPATWSTGAVYSDCPLSGYGSAAATSNPVLSVSPINVAFTAAPGGSSPAPVTVNVNNTGGGTLTFTAASDSAWLTVSPANGTAPQALQVSGSTSGLALGVYTAHVTVISSGAQGSPSVVTVNLTVAKPADWVMVDHDPNRSGNAVDESIITPSNVGSLQLSWSVAVDGPVTGQPLFVSAAQINGQTHNALVVGTGGNSIYALDASTGTQLWKRNFGAQSSNCAIPGGYGITGAPLIDRSTSRVYTVSDDGKFRTLSLADGTDAFPAVSLIANPATNKVWGGLNKVGTNIYVATASDGCDTAPWRGQTYKIDVSGTPTLTGNFVVVPSIAAPNGGGGIWGYGGVSADLATGNIFAASGADSNETYTPYGNRMIALDRNLNLLGSYGPPEPAQFPCNGAPCDLDFGATPVVFQPNSCPTMVAAGNKNGQLYLFKATGLTASTSPFQIVTLNPANDWLGSGGVGGVPAFWQAGNMLFVSDVGPGVSGVSGGVVGLSVTASCTLQVAWSAALGGSTQPDSTPTVANGVVFVGEGATGMVHAYDAQTGIQLWNSGSTTYSAAATYAAPIVAQGNLYVGSWSNFSGGGEVGAFSLDSATQTLAVSPTSLSFTAAQGGSNPSSQTFNVSNTGSGTLNFTASSDSPWLTVSPTSGSAPQALQAAANIDGLTQGNYTGHITVTSAGAQGSPKMVTVSLTVSVPPPPQPVLAVSPTTISFSATEGGSNPSAATSNISNTGSGTLSFTVASDSTWLTGSPASGTAPQTLQVTVNISGLSSGTYTGHITVSAAGAQNSPSTITVTLVVSSTTPPGTVLFGNQTIETQKDSNTSGRAEAFQTTAGVSGTLSSMLVYLDSTSTASKIYLGLYQDNNGHPGTLLTQGSNAQLTKGAWNTVAVTSKGVTSGTKYWIAILGTGTGTPIFRDRGNGPCKSESSSQSTLSALPATWVTGTTYSDCPISAYGQ